MQERRPLGRSDPVWTRFSYWFLQRVGQISRGTVQPISIRQQVQWGGMRSTLHQTEGWASAEATHIRLPQTASNFFSFLAQEPTRKHMLF